MKVDVLGCLGSTRVPLNAAFLPVFEAVINSIHSTQDRFGDKVARLGRVTVRIRRVGQTSRPDGAGRPPVPDIDSISIVDNGVGFDDENLLSFRTAHSTYKMDRGGKGLGRFSWLVVFRRAAIRSSFRQADGELERQFLFRRTRKGIEEFGEAPAPDGDDLSTTVTLEGVERRYAEALRVSTDTVVERLFQHCFSYFVVGRCPAVIVEDVKADGTDRVGVNEKLQEIEVSESTCLSVGEHQLQARHVQQDYRRGRSHEAHLCAHFRVVESFPLSQVSDLSSDALPDGDDRQKVHHVFVSGAALDDAVDSTRTRLLLADDSPLFAQLGALNMKALQTAIGELVNDHLGPVLEAQREENYQRISRHIRTEQPEYRHLLRHRSEHLRRVRWTDDGRRLDQELHKVRQDWEAEVRQRQADLEERLAQENADPDQFAEELHRVVQDVNEAGQAELVRYVARRRAVLNIIRQLIRTSKGTALEEHVHRVVFPMKKTADDVPYDDHNLWLLDDTLSFYEFVASDVPLKQCPPAPTDSLRRPDILAFKVGDEPFQHVALVEFKRPERKDENPAQQLVEYAVLLREGGAKDAHGSTLPGIPMSVRIDAYAVVTLSPGLEMKLRTGPGNMEKVEGAWRWYGGVPAENLSIEVLDFKAFATRAEQRNRAFFTKLGLR